MSSAKRNHRFSSPDNITDAVVQLVTAAVMVVVAAVQIHRDGGLRSSVADLRNTL